ncbi:hypothetical protein [Shewanella waksmanii]|uniref:hypothetical protein n=1 Tax=Shewanella waksmanii TaxID=213783 RepID=UPI00373527E9
MEVFIIIGLTLCLCIVVPAAISFIALRISNIEAIIEVNGTQITLRRFTIERLFRLNGLTINAANIKCIQIANNPARGTCISLFNQANNAVDIWVSPHLVRPLVNELNRCCPHANMVER